MTAWVAPKTWTSGSALTAAELNEQLRDNTLHLKEGSVGTYSEGSWTPTGNGVTFTAAGGNYTKVGRAVIIDGYATWPDNSSSFEALLLSLPFNAISESAVAIGFTNYGSAMVGHVVYNLSRIRLEAFDGNYLTNAQMTGKTVYFSGVYTTT